MFPHLTRRQWLFFGYPAIALAIVAFIILATYFKPAPPKQLTITTGAKDGAYYRYALAYQEQLKRQGVTLNIVNSLGSVENLQWLRNTSKGIAVGFIQGGLGNLSLNPRQTEEDDGALQSLATIAYEPVWIFTTRKDIDSISKMWGNKIAIGAEGSGTRKVALDLLHDAGLTDSEVTLLDDGGLSAVNKLKAGEIDVTFLVASAEAPTIQELLRSPNVQLVNLTQASALSRRLPYLQPILFPQGVFDLKKNIPDRDITLLTTTANLVIRDDLHPALAYLLIDVAVQTHGAPGLLHRPGDFPSPRATDFKLADESKRYFATGRPFLQRYLPYWLANFVERMLVILIPILAVLIPAIKLIPDLWKWRMDKKLYRWYGELMRIERDMFKHGVHPADVPRNITVLNQMEREASDMELPQEYTDKLYTLRQHIDFVRARLNHVKVDGPGPLSQL
jgi:TRAP transporter TAXI family solute receptor